MNAQTVMVNFNNASQSKDIQKTGSKLLESDIREKELKS